MDVNFKNIKLKKIIMFIGEIIEFNFTNNTFTLDYFNKRNKSELSIKDNNQNVITFGNTIEFIFIIVLLSLYIIIPFLNRTTLTRLRV